MHQTTVVEYDYVLTVTRSPLVVHEDSRCSCCLSCYEWQTCMITALLFIWQLALLLRFYFNVLGKKQGDITGGHESVEC